MQVLLDGRGGHNSIQKARFIYLVELSSQNIPRECWFIGTEKFEVRSTQPIAILDNAQIKKLRMAKAKLESQQLDSSETALKEHPNLV